MSEAKDPSAADEEYSQMVRKVFDEGVDIAPENERTRTGTRSLFAQQLRFDLQKGFPLLTTKKVPYRHVVEELFWFLRGETNVKSLQAKGVKIWDANAEEYDAFHERFGFGGHTPGDLGKIYGHQWRRFGKRSPCPRKHWCKDEDDVFFKPDDGFDQIDEVVCGLAQNLWSRRHIVTAWNPRDIGDQALPPCHVMFQFLVRPGKLTDDPLRLCCVVTMRSGDLGLGIPFNIASYATLTHLVAHMLSPTYSIAPSELVINVADLHIYNNHFNALRHQLQREPRKAPRLKIVCNPREAIEDYTFDDLKLEDYDPWPALPMKMAV